MALDRRTWEGIEACRPGSDDLLSAELGDVARRVQDDPAAEALYRRVQTWDTAISHSMDRVSVPPGLSERILERLRSAQADFSTPLAVAIADAQSQTADAEATVASRSFTGQSFWGQSFLGPWSRRRWFAVGSALAATVVVAAFLGQYLQRSDDEPVETMADAWLAELGPKWQDAASAPRGFELPSAITASAVGWQRIGKVVAYELEHATAGRAKLFVVRLAKSGIPTSPPSEPQSTSGKSIGYWRSGDLVYVLVVEGNQNKYRQFVNSARMPLA